MEMQQLFQDISNQQQQQQPALLKTFERRRRAASVAAACDDEAEEPASPALSTASADASPATTSSSPGTSGTAPTAPSASAAASAGLPRHGRRSSVLLRAAALPGHQLFSSCGQTSRSTLLSRMSKARRKAYLAYTQQMAEYFAEVDQFELVEESPDAAATEKRARSKLHPPQRATPGVLPTPLAWSQLRERGGAAGAALTTTATAPAEQHALQSATPGSALRSRSSIASTAVSQAPGEEESSLLASPASSPMLSTAAAAAAGSGSPGCMAAAAATPDKLLSDTPLQQQQQSAAVCSISSSLAGLSLAADTPTATQRSDVGQAAGAAAAGAAAGDELSMSLLAASPAPGHNEAVAATQQADMQTLLHQMQELWVAVTPEGAAAAGTGNDADVASAQQQEQQKQAMAAELIADTPAAKAADKRGQPKERQQQQKAKPKPRAKKQPQQLDAAADAAAEMAAGAPDAEASRQQEEQQQLADQHYQAWLQKQAEAAAVAELQQLELEATAAAELTPLQQMLKACGQSVSLSDIPAMTSFLEDVVDLRDVVKIGEGTYGEAFKSGQVVFKFVPMEGSNLVNGWPQKGAGDLLGEAVIALTLSDLGREHDETGAPHASHTDAFVHTPRVGVCRGPYPPAFIKAWRAWDNRHTSENDPIAGLPEGQLYAVFAMANCGRDLEGYQLQGYDQVRSMMLQTALALAVAEEAVAFEHRDLHWGNIMLSPPHDTHVTARLKDCSIRVRTEGARVRLIDFTASRLQTSGGDVVFCDLEAEDGLFDGPKGKPQFETYRRMRKLTRKDWPGSHPGTNVLWLLYLTELLLSSDKPVPGASAAQKRRLREFKKRLAGYGCCSDVIWDELFEGLWAVV